MNMPTREQFRCANLALAITAPIVIVGAVLLRHASEGVLQPFSMTMFFANFPIYLVLEKRAMRRRGRGQ